MAEDFHRTEWRPVACIAACQPKVARNEGVGGGIGVGREISSRRNEWHTCCPSAGTIDVHFVRGVRWSLATAQDPYCWYTTRPPERKRTGLSRGTRYVGNGGD